MKRPAFSSLGSWRANLCKVLLETFLTIYLLFLEIFLANLFAFLISISRKLKPLYGNQLNLVEQCRIILTKEVVLLEVKGGIFATFFKVGSLWLQSSIRMPWPKHEVAEQFS